MIHIRVAREQKEEFAAIAKRNGLSLAAWVRSTLIAHARKLPTPPPDGEPK